MCPAIIANVQELSPVGRFVLEKDIDDESEPEDENSNVVEKEDKILNYDIEKKRKRAADQCRTIWANELCQSVTIWVMATLAVFFAILFLFVRHYDYKFYLMLLDNLISAALLTVFSFVWLFSYTQKTSVILSHNCSLVAI